jgi:hypothetical protein
MVHSDYRGMRSTAAIFGHPIHPMLVRWRRRAAVRDIAFAAEWPSASRWLGLGGRHGWGRRTNHQNDLATHRRAPRALHAPNAPLIYATQATLQYEQITL